MRKIYLNAICVLFLTVLSADSMAQTIRFVKAGASGDGTSWDKAGDLQTMINTSAANDEVWVASGMYKPTQKLDAAGGLRDQTFILKAGVKIYGGFEGTETAFSERDVADHVSVLSGDLDNNNIASDGDCYHVVASSGNSNGAVLDGFTIQHGYANIATTLAGVARNQGAGINITDEEASVTFANLIIKNNQSSVNTPIANGGAGAYLKLSGESNCSFKNVIFEANAAAASGGAIYFASATGSPTLSVFNCKIFSSVGTGGAGIYVLGTSGNVAQLKVLNSVFSENNATNTSTTAGAVYAGSYSETFIVNCTFYKNYSVNGAVSFSGADHVKLNIYNSIFNANRKGTAATTASADIRNVSGAALDIRSNLLQNIPPDGFADATYKNIINSTPLSLFASTDITSANFLQLIEGEATEKGNNTFTTANNLTTDLAGNPRFTHSYVDLGAYEYQGTLPVELKNFEVQKVNQVAELKWTLASESNNEKFVIERSTDGKNFYVIGEAATKGDTKQEVTYKYTDYQPLAGNNYYKLFQKDKDGTPKLIGLKMLNFGLSAASHKLYPNPAKEEVKIKLNTSGQGVVNVKLVSLTGQILLSKQIPNTHNGQEVSLETARYSSGIYFVIVEEGNTSTSSKLILVN